MIPITLFQEFDQGKPVEVEVPEGIKLTVGNITNWTCAQFNGICRVINTVPGDEGKVVVKVS